MGWITDPQAWAAFATLLALETVLGIDNVVFISILAGKLPSDQQSKARFTGLGLALVTRILLLFSISWIVRLTNPLFEVFGKELSGRDLILLAGGLFLLGKATHELHNQMEGSSKSEKDTPKAPSFASIIAQILLIDIVFSLDSVITAVGMVKQIEIMVAAVVVSVGIMLAFSGPISGFVEKHPTVKVLALSFLLLIGVTLVAEGWDQHIGKGYIYFAMAFSVAVELVNQRVAKVRAERKANAAPA